jgi:hypothetical protein
VESLSPSLGAQRLSSARSNQEFISNRLNAVRKELFRLFGIHKQPLTGDDARAVAISLGYSVGNWLGSVWHEGFAAIGYAKSAITSRKGGLVRLWQPVAPAPWRAV